MYKGIIFDLDGTIADTMGDLMTAMNHMLTHYGFPVRTREDLLKNINGGAVNFVRQSLPENMRDNAEFVQEAFETYIAKYRTCYCDTTNLYDGIAETAYAAKEMRMKLAVHSNKQHEQTVDIIEKLFKPGTFDIIIGYSQFPHKPDPTASLYIAEQFNAEPNEILFVGDSDVDIATAANAGMFAIGVSWGYRNVDVLISKGVNAIVTEA
ncbi:MAG: HAD family hydrolase, partial [Oscillospiraceae bacterium]|nr:HAD family hydrolase [Oscillospiraceae bacterium]